MSRPVKISNELFGALQEDALSRGISMQQALSDRLMALQAQAESTAQDRDELEESLSSAEAELHAALARGSDSQSSIDRLRNEREELLTVIDEMDAAESQLELELSQLRAAVCQANCEKQASETEKERLESQRNALLNILCVLGVVGLLAFAARRLFPPIKTEEPAVPATGNVVPSWYR